MIESNVGIGILTPEKYL